MEIGSAYALQVCLLQIPAMVAFSAWYDPVNMGEVAKTFSYASLILIELLLIKDSSTASFSQDGTLLQLSYQCS